MKKAASISLLCIFLFNTVGYFIAFKTVQYQVKRSIKSEMKSGLSINELTAITINKTDVANIERQKLGKEMFYNNELYDIVRSTETASTITYYCISDKKEKLLLVNLDEHINTHIADQPLKNSTSKKLVDHVIKLYFSNKQFVSFETYSASALFTSVLTFYSPITIDTNSPPPEFV
ncbi:MAG: hypothetical protein H0W84_04160 [Bacteroidetes bacterium]|nr:hypothetical protein [Bacteroidota bacterium]